MSGSLFTIGHSTHETQQFVALLRRHGVTALGDVRSRPYSRFNPQFNRETLQLSLDAEGIAYVFLGEELGARSDDPACYEGGRVRYELLARTGPFLRGLDRICEGMKRHRLALMCAEKDPLECHRTILVARHLAARGVGIEHILEDGRLESHERAVDRLLDRFKLGEPDLFRTREQAAEDAYRLQGERIAYADTGAEESSIRSAAE
jgi:uncharacterized protein (DUF488 family)